MQWQLADTCFVNVAARRRAPLALGAR